MNETATMLPQTYAAALQTFLVSEEESRLEQAREAGQYAREEGWSVAHLASLHQDAVAAFLQSCQAEETQARAVKQAQRFLVEALGSFESQPRGLTGFPAPSRTPNETPQPHDSDRRALLDEGKNGTGERARIENVWRRYHAIPPTARDSLAVIDTDYVCRAANDAYCQAHGRPREEIVGRPVAEVWGPEIFDSFLREPIERCLRGEEVCYLARCHFLAEEPRYVHVNFYPCHLNGNISHVVVITHEATQSEPAAETQFLWNDCHPEERTGGAVLSLPRITEALQAEVRQRRQVEHSLRRREQELGDLFEKAPLGLCRTEQDGTILEVNQAELDLLGYSHQEFIGHHLAEFLLDREVAERLCQLLATQETVRDYEARLRCKDGTIKHTLIDANVLREGDRFVHARCFVRDITGRKQAEGALRQANDELEMRVQSRTAELIRINETLQAEIRQRRRAEEAILESEKRYRLIVETAEEGIWVVDADNRTTFVNRKLAQMLGYRPEEMLGQSLYAFMDEEGRSIAEANVERRRQGLREQQDFKLRHRNGTALWALLATSPVSDEQGRYAGALAMVTDVTERKQAEEELKKRERQLAQAQRIAKLGSWEWDIETNQVTWSDELYRIYGLDPRTGITHEFFLGCVHPEDRPMVQQTVGNACQTREPYDFIHRILRPDGTERILHGHGETITDEHGQPIRIIGTGQDITERKQAEEALRQSEEHYRELFHQAFLMQEKLRNLSNRILAAQEEERRRISRELHDEVGQALTAINVNLAMLKREAREPDGGIARRIEDTQDLLEETMENVHRFARELRPAMLDDLGLLPALRSYVKDFGERTGIRVRLAAPAIEEKLDGEQKTVLYRVAQESLNNIAKHAQATEVEATIREAGGRIQMEIRDNGRGFKLDAHSAGKESKRLGLLGMEERVRLSNGVFRIESQPGKGTRVQIEIPIQTGLGTPGLKSEKPSTPHRL